MGKENLDIVVKSTGAKVVQRDLKKIGTTASVAAGGANLLKRALGFVAVIAVLRSATKTLAEFGQAMSTVQAITRATGDDFTALRNKAKDLGATTRFSATQAAEGMIFLGRAGFDANQVLGAITPTLQLAQAGVLDLATAADIASNVLIGFRLNVDQTGRVVDVLGLAAISSNTSVLQMGEAMKFVAPVAAGLGVSLEVTAAAVGTLANAGLQGTLGGTGLRGVLARLEAPTSTAIKVFRELGVTAAEVKVSQVGLIAALTRLRDAGIDTGQALKAFGLRAGPSFEILKSAIGPTKDLKTALDNADGTVKRVAATMDDNLNGALFAAKSAFEAVVIAIGDLGADSALTSFFRGLADVLRLVAANIGPVVAALKIVTIGFIAAKVATIEWTLALNTNPVVLLITAITAIVAVFVLFKDKIKLSSDGVVSLGDVFGAVFAAIGRVLSFFGGIYRDIFNGFGDIAKFVFGGILEDIGKILAAGGRLLAFLAKLPGIRSLVGAASSIAADARARGELRNKNAAEEAAKAAAAATAANTPISKQALAENTPGPTIDPIQAVIANLEKQKSLLGLLNSEREVQNNLFNIERFLKTELKGADRELIKNELEEIQALQDRANILDEIKGPEEDFRRGQKVLNALLAEGTITIEEFTQKIDEMRLRVLANVTTLKGGIERGLLRIKIQFEDLGSAAENILVNAFKNAEDALLEFVKTGKLSFGSLIDDIITQITRLALQQAILKPLQKSLGGLFGGGGGGGGGILGALGGLFGGGASPIAGPGPGIANVPFNFAQGGEFRVGGLGGTDSQTVAFRATPGENVRVTTPGQDGSGGNRVNVNMTVVTRDAESFSRSRDQIAARLSASLTRAQMRNG